MSISICYVERQPDKFVSLEKSFREIAAKLSPQFSTRFEQVPYSSRVYDVPRNLAFLRPTPADIYHLTGHVNYVALRFPAERTVLSIMDVRFVNMNTGLRRSILKKLYLDLPVKRLKYITAISTNVKNEIVELTGCSPDKIRVLDLPLYAHFDASDGKAFDHKRPTILQVGTMVNKNVVRLIEALRGLDCKLIVVGELDADQSRALAENRIAFENPVGMSDQDMRAAYLNADIVSFCSTYEGFGLPIIEAQGLGKVVLTSDLSPMKDTAGSGALLVDPYDVNAIREGIDRIISDESLRLSLIEKGRKNAKRFSAEVVANQYEELYIEMIADLRD